MTAFAVVETLSQGPLYGYNPNAIILSSHSSLTLQQHFSRALMFRLLVLVTDTYLGAAISTRSFTEKYVSKKVKLRCDEIFTLSTIAKTHPHSAYGTFVHGILHK